MLLWALITAINKAVNYLQSDILSQIGPTSLGKPLSLPLSAIKAFYVVYQLYSHTAYKSRTIESDLKTECQSVCNKSLSIVSASLGGNLTQVETPDPLRKPVKPDT